MTYPEENESEIAIGTVKYGVHLWCRDMGLTKDGIQKFDVINGGWSGCLSPDMRLYVTSKVDNMNDSTLIRDGEPTTILWRGKAPSHFDYNEAIEWINEQIGFKK